MWDSRTVPVIRGARKEAVERSGHLVDDGFGARCMLRIRVVRVVGGEEMIARRRCFLARTKPSGPYPGAAQVAG